MNQIKLFSVILALLLLLGACVSQEETPAPQPTQMPGDEEPTIAPEPTEEPTVAPESTVVLAPPPKRHLPDPALIDTVWQWERRANSGVETVVPNPEAYNLLFNADGAFTATLDCNRSNGNYATDGLGGIFLELGPVAMTECDPGSMSADMANMFGPAQSYSFEEDGQVVAFVWAAGGPSDYYRQAKDNSSANEESLEEPIDDIGADSALVGPTWQWETFQDMAEINNLTVPDSEKYTLTLLPEGVAAVQADCNMVRWTYDLESDAPSASGSLTFNALGPATLAFCGDDSLDQQFLAWIGEVVTYVVEGRNLYLNLRLDSGNLVFGQDGQAAANRDIKADLISLDTQGLPETWQVNIVPASPFDENVIPGPTGLPEHIEINFGKVDPTGAGLGDPIIYIIPAEPYKKLIEDNGHPTITERMDALADYLAQRPDLPTVPMPMMPFEASQVLGVGNLDLAIQRAYLDPVWGSGLRFVGRINQGPNPVINGNFYYMGLGLTPDGKYFVGFYYPIITPALPGSIEEVSAEEMQQVNAGYIPYLEEKRQLLAGLTNADWEPDLATLDAIFNALIFGNYGD